MPEVIFPGPEGRLEGRYHPQKTKDAPIAIVLHPHPQFGGTMNNRVVYNLHYAFHNMGFNVLRFNFRGVGRSQGEYDQGIGELSDAASALDYLQSMNQNAKHCWVAGFSFGAWIGMQLLMRRPEITGFISVSPPANMYDFSFLAPCPSSGLIINGTGDRVAPPRDTHTLVNERDNHWSLGISTEDGTSIVAGRRVVVGWDMLLSVSNESAPTGALICVATEDPLNLAGTGDIDPGLTDLGSRCDILYYTLAELVA